MSNSNTAGWVKVHEGCGGIVGIDDAQHTDRPRSTLVCRKCQSSVSHDDAIEFSTEDDKLPTRVEPEDILYLDVDIRQELVVPSSKDELSRQQDFIQEQVDCTSGF